MPLQWLALIEHELLLFAGVFDLIGSIDELAVDLAWVWLRVTGRARTRRIRRANHGSAPLTGPSAAIGFRLGKRSRGWPSTAAGRGAGECAAVERPSTDDIGGFLGPAPS